VARVAHKILQFGILLILASMNGFATEHPHIEIFVYNDADVPSPVMQLAEAEATRVLARAGLAPQWRDCRAYPERCEDSDGQMVVRIVPRAAKLNGEVFGAAYLSAEGDGMYSNVFFNEMKRIEPNSRLGLGRLLGHVMAHELGHLLLGSNAHAVSGIMRAQWQEHETKQIVMGTLLFSPKQSARMLQRAEARVKPPTATLPDFARTTQPEALVLR
jgi:hypothetical protein